MEVSILCGLWQSQRLYSHRSYLYSVVEALSGARQLANNGRHAADETWLKERLARSTRTSG